MAKTRSLPAGSTFVDNCPRPKEAFSLRGSNLEVSSDTKGDILWI
jgi:hypothetical protein